MRSIPVAAIRPARNHSFLPATDQSKVIHTRFKVESAQPTHHGLLVNVSSGDVGFCIFAPLNCPCVEPGADLVIEHPKGSNPFAAEYTAIYPASMKPIKVNAMQNLPIEVVEETALVPVPTMAQHGEPSMNSREIAALLNVRHDKVMQSIERLAARGVITLPPLGEVSNPGMGPRTIKQYTFSGEKGKRDTYVVVAQLSPEHTATLVDRWQELEKKVQELTQQMPALPNFANPAEAARAWAQQYEQREAAEYRALTAEYQRDEAIRTKAAIGSKREATAMVKVAIANRTIKTLKEQLGFGEKFATVKAVESATNIVVGPNWRELRRYCAEHSLTPEEVPDPQYGKVKAWPAEAWQAVFGVELLALFGTRH